MIYGAQVFIPVFHDQFSIIENKPDCTNAVLGVGGIDYVQLQALQLQHNCLTLHKQTFFSLLSFQSNYRIKKIIKRQKHQKIHLILSLYKKIK